MKGTSAENPWRHKILYMTRFSGWWAHRRLRVTQRKFYWKEKKKLGSMRLLQRRVKGRRVKSTLVQNTSYLFHCSAPRVAVKAVDYQQQRAEKRELFLVMWSDRTPCSGKFWPKGANTYDYVSNDAQVEVQIKRSKDKERIQNHDTDQVGLVCKMWKNTTCNSLQIHPCFNHNETW